MVLEIENFLSDEVCDKLIELSTERMNIAETLGDEISGYRTAHSCWLEDYDDQSVINFRKQISETTNLPTSNMELTHIVSYDIGGEYKEHHDFFHPTEGYFEEEVSRGGQRTKTALVYLNDDFSGGETNFPNLGIKVKPKKGKLVLWDNLDENGEIDYDSIHAGLPVIEGRKYIAVIWIREKTFI